MSSSPGSTGSSTGPDGPVEGYLERLSAALSALPESDRREIVEETRSHIADRWGDLDPEAAERAALADLGPPEAYAAAFLENYDAGEPPRPGGPGARRVAALVAGVALLGMAVAAGLFGLFQILTIPPSTPGWMTWRDVTLGDRGWALLLVACAILGVVLALAGTALVRRGGSAPRSSGPRGNPARGGPR